MLDSCQQVLMLKMNSRFCQIIIFTLYFILPFLFLPHSKTHTQNYHMSASTISELSYDDLILETPPSQRLQHTINSTHSPPTYGGRPTKKNLDIENIMQPSPAQHARRGAHRTPAQHRRRGAHKIEE